jgi:multiple sugar transport system permease protein
VVILTEAAVRASAPERQRPLTGSGKVQRVIQYLLLTLLALFCLVPFAWLLLTAVDAKAGPELRWPQLTIANFVHFFTDAGTPRLLANSLLIAIAATVVALVLGTLGGYALSRFRFPGRRVLMFFILLIRVVPPTATVVPLYLMMIKLGLNNTYLGLILVEAAYQLPITLWLLKGFVDSIPIDLEEAAWMDGSTRLGAIRRIVFPLARPGVGAAALFAFIAVWGDFLTPLVLLQSEEMYPLSIGLFRAFSAFNQVDWGLLTATAVLYMLPPAVLYLFVRRYLLKGTVTGAVKG